MWERVWVSVYTDENAESVHEWARPCVPAGHPGVGGRGFPGGATAATSAQPGTSDCIDPGGPWVGSGAVSSGGGESTNRVIVSLWDSSHRHPGEIQRETLPKAVSLWQVVASSDWDRLRDFGGGECEENRPPQGSVLQHGDLTETLSKEELRQGLAGTWCSHACAQQLC